MNLELPAAPSRRLSIRPAHKQADKHFAELVEEAVKIY